MSIISPPLPGTCPGLITDPPRKAAWWAWFLILFSILPITWLAGLLPDEKSSSEETVVSEGDVLSELAMLKLQGQVTIATARFEPKKVEETLDQLEAMMTGERTYAGLALLENYVLPDSGRASEILEDQLSNASSKEVDLVKKAVTSGVNDEERLQLQGYLGEWFASLAPGENLADPPQKESIELKSLFALGTISAMVMGAGLCILTGVVLLIFHFVRLREYPGANAMRNDLPRNGILLEGFALYLAIMTCGGLLAEWIHPSFSLLGYGLAVIIPLLWPLLRGMKWAQFRKEIGLHRGKGVLREIGAGFVGYTGVLAIASVGILIMLVILFASGQFSAGALEGAGSEAGAAEGGAAAPAPGPQPHPIIGWIYEGGWAARIACLFLAAVFAPIIEEIFFRGLFHRYLRGRFRFVFSAILGGVIFAVLHPQGLYAVPALAAMAVGFAVIREWRDSLIAPMVAHSINNGVLVMTMFALL